MTPHGERYILPTRTVPWQRSIGLGIVTACLLVIAAAAWFTSPFWIKPAGALLGGQPVRAQDLLGLLALLVPMVATLGLAKGVRLGLIAGFGHSEILLRADRVVGIERVGPITRRTTIDRADATAVIVEPGFGSRHGRSDNGPMRGLGALVIERGHDDEQRRHPGVAFAYDLAVLDQLGHELGDKLGLEVRAEDAPASDGDGPRATPTPARPVKRPRGATGVITTTADGISIELPAMGFFRASKGLGSFAVLWFLFISVFTGFWVFALATKGMGGGAWFALLIIGAFWCAGLLMVWSAMRSGRRRGVIDVVGRDLLITRQSLGRPRSEDYHAEEIASVAAGPSGTEINDKPVLELQVWLRDGRKRGFFPERKDAELRWIAGELVRSLGIAAASEAEPETERADTPRA